jgi:hypothetical protein
MHPMKQAWPLPRLTLAVQTALGGTDPHGWRSGESPQFANLTRHQLAKFLPNP